MLLIVRSKRSLAFIRMESGVIFVRSASNVVLVIAHRGASGYEPENTLRSIRRALEMGADLVEVDVRMSRDGEIVVIHDARVDRTTNGAGYVRDMTLQQLKRLDAGLGERIPTLEEVIHVIKGKVQLVIEIKVPGIEEAVLRAVRKDNVEDAVLITSFHHPVVKQVKVLGANVKTGVIFASRPIQPVRLVIDANADALFPKHLFVDMQMVEEAHEHGLMVCPWTVDDPQEIRPLIEANVDGIVTNKPDVVKHIIKAS
ncbi:MAG: glycerophosphodiester phosphodiesterase [Candidatus Freyarchaeota archaeon]